VATARVVVDHPTPIPPGWDQPAGVPRSADVRQRGRHRHRAEEEGTVNPLHRSAFCRLEIRGSPPAGVTADIDRRFGPVDVVVGRYRTVLRVLIQDQAALRGLLTLLWDHNQEVLLLRLPSRPQP
jgi:hypothetical protein